MLKRVWVPVMLVVFSIFFILAGCGSKSSQDVVGSLKKKLEQMESYSGKATLVLQSSQTPQEYDVEVWHKKPDYYRIGINNRERNITQIILRNEEGVFVLTPHLNKSFRFQSSWPDNNGQIYLFESLARSIIDDEERQFVKENDGYMYHVKANYQNRSLVSQKIWLQKDTLEPKKVQVLDTDLKVLVELTFHEFRFDVKFDDDSFEMDRNMTGYRLSTSPEVAKSEDSDHFWPLQPGYMPSGVNQISMNEVKREQGSAFILKYGGEYQYTIIQEKPKEKAVNLSIGDPIDLGFTVGVLTKQGDVRTLTFTYDGIDFTLMSADLPIEEMQSVATSVFGQVGK